MGTERKRKTIALNMQLLSPHDMQGKQKLASGGNDLGGLRDTSKQEQQLDQIQEDSNDEYSHKFSSDSSSEQPSRNKKN